MGILLNLLGLGNKCLDWLGSNQAVRTSLGSIKEVLGAKVRKTYLVWFFSEFGANYFLEIKGVKVVI